MKAHKSGRHRIEVAVLAAVLLTPCGCGMFGDGVSDFERQRISREGAADLLKEQGAKFEQKTYPQGVAWAVDLNGMDITDQTLELLGKVGRISELNLSGSSITDDQIAELNDINLSGVMVKLDLSKTGITDAGIAEMTKFGFLKELNLTGTEVTASAIESFQAARKENADIIPMMKNVNVVK
jgi:hypothetical protein